MTLCLALLLLAPDDLPFSLSDPEPEPPPSVDHDLAFLRLRGGVWSSRQFSFDAITVSSTEQRSKQSTFGSAGADLGAALLGDRFVLFGSAEGAFANKLRIEDAGVCFGFRDWADPGATSGIPQEAMIYAGPIYAKLDVMTTGFADFDPAWGARAGVSFTWKLSRPIGISLVVEYRYLKFEVKDKSQISSGSTSMGASGVWGGLGIDLRF